MLDRLAEPESGIPADAVSRDTQRLKATLSFLQIGLNVANDILVVRGARAMHDDESALRSRRGFKRSGHLKASDVVEDVCAERSHLSHDLGFGGIDTYDEALPHKPRHHGNDAAALLVKRHAGFIKPRSCGLPADIDDVSSGVAHAVCPTDGILKIVVSTAIRKGIGRHVENAHDERLKAVNLKDLCTAAPNAGAFVENCHLVLSILLLN